MVMVVSGPHAWVGGELCQTHHRKVVEDVGTIGTDSLQLEP